MKTNRFFYLLLVLLSSVTLFSSCEKENEVTTPVKATTGVIVLNAGSLDHNNSSLTYFDLAEQKATTDAFGINNNRIMGDTGEDIIQYGSKIYISVYGSSLLEVIDPKTMISLKTIPMKDDAGKGTKPRSLTCSNGKIYAVLYSGSVAMIDTASLTVEKTIEVGPNPEKSVISNNKLYVGVSGGMAAVKDSTVAVINLSNFTLEKKITVNLNPSGSIGADSNGNIYILSMGNYYNIAGKFQRIDARTGKVTDIVLTVNNDTVEAKGFVVYNDKAYIYTFDYDKNYQATNKRILVYNLKTEQIVTESLVNSTIDKTPFGIGVDPKNGDLYLSVSDYITLGKVYCYSNTGTEKYSFETGINPCKFLFVSE